MDRSRVHQCACVKRDLHLYMYPSIHFFVSESGYCQT